MSRRRLCVLFLMLTLTGCWPHHRHVATRSFVCQGAVDIQGPSYVGVLFPPECWRTAQFNTLETVYGYWTASSEPIAAAEGALRPALEAAVQNPAAISLIRVRSKDRAAQLSHEIEFILGHLGKYRRQYLGVTISGGHQRLLINFFPAAEVLKADPFPYWKQRWVTFNRGESWYWQIMYDVRTGVFSELRSNGYE